MALTHYEAWKKKKEEEEKERLASNPTVTETSIRTGEESSRNLSNYESWKQQKDPDAFEQMMVKRQEEEVAQLQQEYIQKQEANVEWNRGAMEAREEQEKFNLKSTVNDVFKVAGQFFKTAVSGDLNKATTIDSATQKSIRTDEGKILAEPVELSDLEKREIQMIRKGSLESSSKVETQQEVLQRKMDNPIEYLINRPYAKTEEGYLVGDVDKTPMEVMQSRIETASKFYNSLSEEEKIRIKAPDFVDEDTFYYTSVWADDTISRIQNEIDLIDKQLASETRVVQGEYQTELRGELSDKDRRQMINRKEQLQEYIGGLEMVKQGQYTERKIWDGVKSFFDNKDDTLMIGALFSAEESIVLLNAYGKLEKGEELNEREKMLVERDDLGDTIEYLTNEYTLGYEITTGLVGSAKLMLEIYLSGKLFELVGLGTQGITLGTAKGSSKAAQISGNLLRSTAKAGQVTLTAGAGRVIEEAHTRQTPVFQYYWDTGERVKTKEGESPKEAWIRAFALEYGNNFIEVGLGVLDDPTDSIDNFVKSLIKEGALDSFPEEFTEEILQKLWEEMGINNKQIVLPKDYTDSENQFTFTPRELLVTGVTTLLLGSVSNAVAGGQMTQEQAEQVRLQLEANMQDIHDKADGRTQEELKKILEEEKNNNPVDGTDYDAVIDEVGTGETDRDIDIIEQDVAKIEAGEDIDVVEQDIAEVEAQGEVEQVETEGEAKVEQGKKIAPTLTEEDVKELAKDQIRSYVERGDDIQDIKQMGGTLGDFVGMYDIDGKQDAQVTVELADGREFQFSRQELYDEIKQETQPDVKVDKLIEKNITQKLGSAEQENVPYEDRVYYHGLTADRWQEYQKTGQIPKATQAFGGMFSITDDYELAKQYAKGGVVLQVRVIEGVNVDQASQEEGYTGTDMTDIGEGEYLVGDNSVIKEVEGAEVQEDTTEERSKKKSEKKTPEVSEKKKDIEQKESKKEEDTKKDTKKKAKTEKESSKKEKKAPKEEEAVHISEVKWTGMKDADKLKLLNNSAQDAWEQDFDELTPKRALDVLAELEGLNESYINTTDTDVLKKLGRGAGLLSVKDTETRPDVFIFKGLQEGVYTDGMILFEENKVANQLMNKFKDQIIDKEAKQLQKSSDMSLTEAKKQVLKEHMDNAKDLEFPDYKSIMPKSLNFELKEVGFIVEDGIGRVIFINANGTYVHMAGKFYNAVKSFYPDARFFTANDNNVEAISFTAGKDTMADRKGVVMPMMGDANSDILAKLVGKESLEQHKENIEKADERREKERKVERAKELKEQDVKDDIGISLIEYLNEGKQADEIPTHKGKIGYLGQGTYEFNKKTGKAVASLADGRTFEFEIADVYENKIEDILKNRVDGRTWFENTFGREEYVKRFGDTTPKDIKYPEGDLPFRKTTGERKRLDSSKLNNMQLTQMKKISRQVLGDEKVELIEQIVTPDTLNWMGRYIDDMIQIRSGSVDKGSTLYHEIVHKALDIFLTPSEKAVLLKEVRNKVGDDYLKKEYAKRTTTEKNRLFTYEDTAVEKFQSGLQAAKKGWVGVQNIDSTELNEADADYLADLSNSVDIDATELFSSVVQEQNLDTGEIKYYLVEGEVDATHAINLIDEGMGHGGQLGNLNYWVSAIDQKLIKVLKNPFVDVGKFDPRKLPYSYDPSTAASEREYRIKYGITKNGKGKYRGVDIQDANLDMMAEEWLAENIIEHINQKTPSTFVGKLKRMVEQFVDRWFKTMENIDTIENFYEGLLSGRLLKRERKAEQQRQKAFGNYIDSIKQTSTNAVYRTEVAKQVKNLTTKILKSLEGKQGFVSKQFISDLTKQKGIKKVEADIINEVLKKFDDQVEVATFEQRVMAELLPLERMGLIEAEYPDTVLSEEVRGDVQFYEDVIYNSPVKTMAGYQHWRGLTDNYFGHIRSENMADGITRRIIEIQSDLFQRGRIEEEGLQAKRIIEEGEQEGESQQFIFKEAQERLASLEKLEQYNNPTAHLRMVREEVRNAAVDGKEVLLFPTGKTALAVEGIIDLGDSTDYDKWIYEGEEIKPKDVKQGMLLTNTRNNQTWLAWSNSIAQMPSGYIFEGVDPENPVIQESLEKLQDVKQLGKDTGLVSLLKTDGTPIMNLDELRKNNGGELPAWIEQVMANIIQYKDVEGTLKTYGKDLEIAGYDVENVRKVADAYVALALARETQFLDSNFDEGNLSEYEEGVYNFYEKTLAKYLKNEYGAEQIEDEQEVGWWRINITPEHKQAVEAFRLDNLVDYNQVAQDVDSESLFTQYLQETQPEVIEFKEGSKEKYAQGGHEAPMAGENAPIFDLAGEYTDTGIYPEDIYSYDAARLYGAYTGYDQQAINVLHNLRGKPNARVMVYRAVPKGAKGGINAGDWVTTVREYAKEHGEGNISGDYKIVKKYVYARDLFTDGNSIVEFGYDPQSRVTPDQMPYSMLEEYIERIEAGEKIGRIAGYLDKKKEEFKQQKLEVNDDVKYRLEEDTEVEIPLPELVTLATEIGTDVSLSSRLRKSLGTFQSQSGVPAQDTKIKLLRALFEPQGEEMINAATGEVERLPETPEQIRARVKAIERTLGHEIGHLIDWFGGDEEAINNTLGRGNILGRLASFKGYLKHTLMTPDQQEQYTQLKREADNLRADRKVLKDKEGKITDKTEYNALGKQLRKVNKQLKAMDEDVLAKMPEVMTELKTLTQIWKPFDENIDEEYTKYRYKSEELYADALSVLFNDPQLLKQTAPTFYNAFVEYLANKPKVKELYFGIRDSIKQGANIQARINQMIQNQQEAQGKRMTIEQEKEEYKKLTKWENWKSAIKMGLYNEYAPYIDFMRKQWKQGGIELSKLEEVEQMMGDLKLKGNDSAKYAEDVQEQFFNPVSEAGIDVETVGNILILERNLGDRVDLANPQGLMYDYAKETYEAVKKKLTPAQWAFLQEKLNWWRDYNFQIVKEGYEAGVYSEKFFDEIATVNKNTYTPFAVVHYIEDNYVTAGVIQAKGTLKGVENPLNTQMMKSLSLIRLKAVNEAKKYIVDDLKENFGENIHEAKAIRAEGGRFVRFKKNAELERKGYTMLELLEDGKRKGYYIDKYIVAMFENNYGTIGWEILRAVAAPFKAVNRVFRPLVTVFKASFQFYSNPIKDYLRSVTNLTALSGLFDERNVALRTGKVFKAFTKEWIKSLKQSWDYAGDVMSPVTRKMLDMYVLSRNVKYEDIELGSDKFKFDPVKKRVVYKGSANFLENIRDVAEKIPLIKSTIVPLYDLYMRAGATLEVNSKIAGFQTLTQDFKVDEKKAALYTRKYVGTPDYMQSGKLTFLTNNLFPFSNVGLQAISADASLATRPNTASGYWFSTVVKTVLPKLLMLLGSQILRVPIPDPDDEDKKIWVNPYDYLSEYYKGMYMSFPVGYDKETGKFLFVKVPQDEVSNVVGDAVWKMGTYLMGEGMKIEQLASALIGFIPAGGGMNPLIAIGTGWKQYLQGRNPYDDFRGRLAINTSKWNEGGLVRFTEMLKWSSNEMGLTNFQTYEKDFNTTREYIFEAPILERAFELTDYGKQEREEYLEMQGKKQKSKELDTALQSYYAEPSDKNLLKYQQEYVTAVKGEEPEGGWHGTELAEKTRLENEFKREVLAQSGNGEYKKIAKYGLSNDEKEEILDAKLKNSSKQETIDYLSQVVRYEVVKGEMFAQYAKKNNLSDDEIYQIVKSSIPVLDGESNNTLLWELRKIDLLSDDALGKLYRQDKLITRKGYSKYKELNSKVYEQRYVRDTDEQEDERNRLF